MQIKIIYALTAIHNFINKHCQDLLLEEEIILDEDDNQPSIEPQLNVSDENSCLATR